MKTKQLILDSIFAAAAIILYLIHFSLPIFPPFLEINLSLIPIIIAIMLFKAPDAFIIVLLRAVGKIITLGTTTAYVGELADILIGCILIIILYLLKRKIKNIYLLGITIVLSLVIGGIITNLVINIPLYIRLMGLSIEALVSMCSIIPGISVNNFYLYYTIFAVIPFNLILGFIVSIISLIIYSRLKNIKYFIE